MADDMRQNIKNTIKELRDMSDGYDDKIIRDMRRFNYWITTNDPNHLNCFLDEIIMEKDKDRVYKALLNLYPLSKNIFFHILEKRRFHSEIKNAFPQFEEPLKLLRGLWDNPKFEHYLENSPSLDKLKNQIDELVEGYELKKDSVPKCVLPVLEADIARLQIISDLVEAVQGLEDKSFKDTVVEDITYVKKQIGELAEREFLREAIRTLKESLEGVIGDKVGEIDGRIEYLKNEISNIVDNAITKKLNDTYDKILFQQKALTTFQNDILGEDGEMAKLKNKFKNFEDEFKEFRKNSEVMFGILSKLKGEAATKDEINKLEQGLVKLIGGLSKELLGEEGKITNQQNQLKELQKAMEDIRQWQVGFAEKQGKVDNLKEEISNLKKDIEEKENEKSNINKANKELTSNIEALENEKKTLQTKMNIWEDREKIYVPVKEALQNCDTFSAFMEERGLCNISDCFPLMLAIGDELKFAQALHKAAKDSWKAKSRQTIEESNGMTIEEQQVYMALNQCYKSILPIDFDIFALPGGKAIGSPCTDIKFDTKESLNMMDATKKSYRSVEVVYVPVLRKKDQTVMEYAQVKGTMN